jgi:hypothetical protein
MSFTRRHFLRATAPLAPLVESLGAADEIPSLNSVPPDLEIPAISPGEPGPGKRVRQVLPKFTGTELYHLLYLPVDWTPERRYPVIVEYAGNGVHAPDGKTSHSGEVESSKLGYGISAGKGFIWLCPPYVNKEHTRNERRWWGDIKATIDYLREAVQLICGRYGGDPSALILVGFSRGAIACNYIGLHDDEIADLWLAFIPFSHYDGVNTRWPYEGADRESAIRRLKRLKGRAVFICQERSTDPPHSIATTKAYLESTAVEAPFTYQEIPFGDHNNAWVLCDTAARTALRQWLTGVLQTLPGRARAGEPGGAPLVDARFPGGNIVVDSIEGDTISLHQDLRDTEGWWFYWAFRVRGAAGRTLTFRFTNQNPIGVRGPAVSLDGGRTWRWLGTETVNAAGFRFAFPPGAGEVRFSMTIPYLESDLRAFEDRNRANPRLEVDGLCQSPKGRSVEKLRAGRLDGKAPFRILLTARNHACEAMANFALEGVLATVLSDSGEGAWFQENVEILAVPFMDKDGVEDGDQGKGRRPHDHVADYQGESIYPEPRALRSLVPGWAAGRLRIALDLHCPALRGGRHERIHFVGTGGTEEGWERVESLSRALERVKRGPLPFQAADNLPWGKYGSAAEARRQGRNFVWWASELPGVEIATTIEIHYANAGGQTVTPESARLLGADLARAFRAYLERSASMQI